MNIEKLIEGYYAGSLTDAEEEELEMLMRVGHPGIPAEERRLYLGLANLPVERAGKRMRLSVVLKIASAAATIALVVGLGTYTYNQQQQQKETEQEILEMAMGNMSMALKESDKSREKVALIFKEMSDTTNKKEVKTNSKGI